MSNYIEFGASGAGKERPQNIYDYYGKALHGVDLDGFKLVCMYAMNPP